jgi:hypothetical protein
MRLTDTRRTKKDHIASFVKETPRRQFVDEPAVQRWLSTEVKILQAL